MIGPELVFSWSNAKKPNAWFAKSDVTAIKNFMLESVCLATDPIFSVTRFYSRPILVLLPVLLSELLNFTDFDFFSTFFFQLLLLSLFHGLIPRSNSVPKLFRTGCVNILLGSKRVKFSTVLIFFLFFKIFEIKQICGCEDG